MKKLTPETADALYLHHLELTDLDFGEPVYMSDGMFILPDGTIFYEDDFND